MLRQKELQLIMKGREMAGIGRQELQRLQLRAVAEPNSNSVNVALGSTIPTILRAIPILVLLSTRTDLFNYVTDSQISFTGLADANS